MAKISYGNDWNKQRKAALKRDENKCVFCGGKNGINVHHIKPLSRGGTNELFNLITLCHSCHVEDHKSIKRDGLCTVPGPDYDSHWYELTNHDDALAYADKLDAEGMDGRHIRVREMER